MDDRDSVTVIGSKSRGGGSRGGSAPQRGNDKKFTTGNKVGRDGQHDRRVDLADGIIKPKKIDAQVGNVIRRRRQVLGWSAAELAKNANVTASSLAQIEKGDAVITPVLQNDLSKLEKALNVHLRGKNIGSPRSVKEQEREDALRAETKKREKEAEAKEKEAEAKAKAKREEEEGGGGGKEEAGEKKEEEEGKVKAKAMEKGEEKGKGPGKGKDKADEKAGSAVKVEESDKNKEKGKAAEKEKDKRAKAAKKKGKRPDRVGKVDSSDSSE